MLRTNVFAGLGAGSALLVVVTLLGPGPAFATTPVTPTHTTTTAPAGAATTPALTVLTTPASVHEAKRARITRKQARARVLKLVPHSKVVTVRKAKHRGYRSFAVTVRRKDGSTVTGFVDRKFGVVFDWKVGDPPKKR